MLNRTKRVPRSFNLDRVLLNWSGSNDPRDHYYLRQSFTNVFISGDSGSGKSSGSGFALSNALLNKKNLLPEEKVGMIIFLFKSTDAENWLRWAFHHDREDDVIHIREDDRDVFNILSPFQDQEPFNAVQTLMTISDLILGGGDRQKSEGFWETAQATRLDRLIRLNQLAGLPLNIETLYRIHISAPMNPEDVASDDFRKSSFCWRMLETAADHVGEDHEDFRLVENYFLRDMAGNMAAAERTLASILAMVSGLLEPFLSSSLLKRFFCGGSTLSLEDVFNGKIILLDIPLDKHQQIARMAQILLKFSFQRAVLGRDLEQYPNPVIFWQDEAQNYLLKTDHSFMSVARSYRAGNILLSQNISNFYDALGGGPKAQAKVNSLLGLCNTRIYHSNLDSAVTNEWASKNIGRGIKTLNSTTMGKQNGSVSVNQQLQFMVQPREFTYALRTGGPLNDFLVDGIVTCSGRTFSSGQNFLKATFGQPLIH